MRAEFGLGGGSAAGTAAIVCVAETSLPFFLWGRVVICVCVYAVTRFGG